MPFESQGVEVFKLNGLEQLLKKLDSFEEKVMVKVEKSGMKKVTNLLKEAAIAKTPLGPTGNLKKGWDVRVGRIKCVVYGSAVNIAQHAHLIEWGHRFAYKAPRGKNKPGKIIFTNKFVPGKPFARPALNTNVDNILNALAQTIEQSLEDFNK